jgi:hypothetical protein
VKKERGENMTLKEKIVSYIKSKKGNTLLLASAAAISATFGVYFFVSLTTLSEETKQRVTHLYNAYTMGLSVEGKINGDSNRLGDLTKAGIQDSLNEFLVDGVFISLFEMVKQGMIVVGNDPTATTRGNGTKIKYDDINSGVKITYLDADGNTIADDAASTTVVGSLSLAVNLAGTADTQEADGSSNLPYDAGTPFYYVLMDNTQPGVQTSLITTTITDYTNILDATDGGPQPESSVLLPQDND